jgi:hypothetical protein
MSKHRGNAGAYHISETPAGKLTAKEIVSSSMSMVT